MRPRRIALGVLLVLALPAVMSCRRQEAGPLLPSAQEYRRWAQTVPAILSLPIPGHEDNRRRIFINAAGAGAQPQSREGRTVWDYPQGTILLKEIYPGLEGSADDPPVMLTAMIKKPGDPAARGGWLWVVKDLPEGEERIVDWEFCFDCHAGANEPHPYGDRNPAGSFRDYVFYPYNRPAQN